MAGIRCRAPLLLAVPQARRRAVVIGRRRGLPAVPHPDTVRSAAPSPTVREALSRLTQHVPPEAIDLPDGTYEFDGHEFPGAFKTSQLHITRKLTEISRRRIATIPPGGNRMNIPDELLAPCWRRHKTGSMEVMGRLHPDRWCGAKVSIARQIGNAVPVNLANALGRLIAQMYG